jgi:hypothetical protein
MTRHDTLQCVHEPFGDAYYFGPERLAERYENDPKARKESGYEDSTYRTIFDRIARENSEVRLLILFIFCSFSASYLFPSFFFPLHPINILFSQCRQLRRYCVLCVLSYPLASHISGRPPLQRLSHTFFRAHLAQFPHPLYRAHQYRQTPDAPSI